MLRPQRWIGSLDDRRRPDDTVSSERDDLHGGSCGRVGDRPVLGVLALRLRVRRRWRRLDRALAQGASPDSSPELAWRAQQLALPRTRAGLARELINLIDAAEEPLANWRAYGIDPPLRASAVLRARTDLVSLAERLASDGAASIQGLALAAVLIEDPSSPIYSAPAQADVGDMARRACEAADQPGAPPAV